MDQTLRILILEDRREDAKLIERELRAGGLSFTTRVVEAKKAYIEAIDEFAPHLVLAEYKLPAFDGMTALTIARARCPDTPFIFVSGSIGEEKAIEALKQGATDYVLKDRLSRLVPVVTRAMKEAELRILRKQAEQTLQENEQHYRSLFDNMLNGFAYCRMLFDGDRPYDFIYLEVNSAFESLTGLKNVVGKKVSEVIPGIRETDPKLLEVYGRVASTGKPERFEILIKSVEMWFSVSVYSPQQDYFVAVFDVITEQKRAEQALRKSLEEKVAFIEEIHRLNRLYDVLSQVNQEVVRVRSRDELFSAVCRHLVERGAVDLAWIGWLDPITSGISPVVWFGDRSEMLSEAPFHADEWPEGEANSAGAMRERGPLVCNGCGSGLCLYPSERVPARFGFKSCGSFPLRFQGEVCGTLNLCVAEPGFFRERETELLKEVAIDVSFALDKIEGEMRRERLSEEFRRQSMFLRTLLDAMPFPVFYKDTQLRYLGCNSGFEQFVGIKRDEIIGRTVRDVWPRDLAELYLEDDREIFAGKGRTVRESVIEVSNGVRYDILVHRALFQNPDGTPGGIIGAFEDITERKRAAKRLQESERKYRRLLESITDAFAVVDMSGRIVEFNRAFQDMLGYSREELTRLTYLDITPARWHAKESRIVAEEVLSLGHSGVYEKEYIHKDGSVFPVELRSYLVRDQDGMPGGIWAIIRDITERKQAEAERIRVEAQLRQAQKMEAIGTLAGGIAHDFNNILGIIMGNADMALFDTPREAPTAKYMQQVTKAAFRAKDLVQQILTFSRLSEHEKKPLNISPVIKEALKLLRSSLPSTIEIRQSIGVPFAEDTVLADPTQIHQVLMNLCTNSAHAMRERGGVLEVKYSFVDFSSGDPGTPSDLDPGRYVELTVSDTGHGMSQEVMERIFEPYFTTKSQREGTGLGLAVVHGIVKNHGGTITVTSSPGEGTTFRAFFPRWRGSVVKPEQEIHAPLPRGSETILLVDDESALLQVGRRMLERLGYTVVVKSCGMEALEEFRARPHAFDLVITDQTMPKMTGMELSKELLALRPDLPVVLCTGFSESLTPENQKAAGIRAVAMKPIDTRHIASTVRKVLDGEDVR
jgi:PAS domain S-box-containing protein